MVERHAAETMEFCRLMRPRLIGLALAWALFAIVLSLSTAALAIGLVLLAGALTWTLTLEHRASRSRRVFETKLR